MVICYSSDFYHGLKIIINNEPYEIEYSEFIKPGKGQTFTRVKLRRLLTGTLIEKTFKSTDLIECADVIDMTMTYLYHESTFWHFINKKTFEQLTVDDDIIGNNAKWLSSQIDCIVTLWNDKAITINLPNFVELKIINTNPNFKGDTIGTNSKLATLSTGAVIKVPSFIEVGEIVKVDTRFGKYVSRAK